jgi:hypothetical protein
MSQRRWLFVANRALLILAVAATLAGLALEHWNIVLVKALIL